VLLNAERRLPMRYPGDTVENSRDLRIDVLRGLAICFVVVNHIDIPSAYHVVSQEAIAPITGAEMFVALSGVVLAMAYRRRAELGVRQETMVPLWRRARKLYLTAVAVAVLAWLTQFIPGVDARVLTTWAETDADGKLVRWDLYGGAAYGLPWPVPGHLLGDLLFLRIGPSQFNVIGLYVVLLAAAPLVLALLKRDRWRLVLGASVAVYALYRLSPQQVLPSTFEHPFPLMAWQLLFVLGMLAGWYRAALLRFAGTVWGRVCLAASVVLFLAAFFFTSNNPWKPFVAVGDPGGDVRVALHLDVRADRPRPGPGAGRRGHPRDAVRRAHRVLAAALTDRRAGAGPAGSGHAVRLRPAGLRGAHRGQHPAALDHTGLLGLARAHRGAGRNVADGPAPGALPGHPALTVPGPHVPDSP